MARTTLLKRIEGFELWSSISDSQQHFAVKTREKRVRFSTSLADAEAHLAKMLRHARCVRAD
jgi:hypothetical protein